MGSPDAYHDAHVGPFIFLVQGEIVAAVSYLVNSKLQPGLTETPQMLKREVAKLWLENFVRDAYATR